MPPSSSDPLASDLKWMVGTGAPPLEGHDVHIWRVHLGRAALTATGLATTLSAAERSRMARFANQNLRDRFALAHGALRQILAKYTVEEPAALAFEESERGKPSLTATGHDIAFNLSHSGDIALVAVTRGRAIGVDVEQWKDDVEHLSLAEYCFSPNEQRTLHALAHDQHATAEGFFSAWSRKEAYIKAFGAGVADGLDHFDVTLRPGEAAALLEDRRDPRARERWIMRALDVGNRYSAALVVEAPLGAVVLLEFNAP